MYLFDFFANYFKRGYGFTRYNGQSGRGTVVILHGWGVRATAMRYLAELLNHQGYEVLNYDYPTSRLSIKAHGKKFLTLLRNEKVNGKIFFLTHSMGGLVLRYSLSMMSVDELDKIASIVMLGPPNGGSGLAVFGRIFPVNVLNRSLKEMTKNSPVLAIPPPAKLPPVGIIAGSRDGKVAFSSTALPGGLPFERMVVKSSHHGLRDPRKTGKYVLRFFKRHGAVSWRGMSSAL